MEATKEQIQAWVREEQERIDLEKQETCDHRVSGTLKDGVLTCDACSKVLVFDPNESVSGGDMPRPSAALFKGVGK